jgi:hypothetical protein
MQFLFILITLLLFYAHARPQAIRNQVVISEIMADPSPSAGLPESEFLELHNVSSQSFNLNGWKISDASGTATISSNFMLKPDSFVIICSNPAVAQFSVYGAAIGVSSFPGLDNESEQLALFSKEGKLIHSLRYQKSWYRNAVKSEGGWTLEMISPLNACSGFTNWKASSGTTGGTPGKKNTAHADNTDELPPALLRAFAADSMSITLVFDEPLDSLKAVHTSNFTVSHTIGEPAAAKAIVPLFNTVVLQLKTALQKNVVYSVTVKSVTDCSGTEIGSFNTTNAGMASITDSFDLVINEIMFNPLPGASDYVELYNRGQKIVDLKELVLTNRSSGNTGALRSLSSETVLLFPGEYLVLTEDPGNLKQQYHVKDPAAIIEVGSMPSFPDDKGTVVLLNSQGTIIDEVNYDEKWHFKLIEEPEGVALERIDYNKPSADPQNWHSAATDFGYGTPASRNSQFRLEKQVEGVMSVTPEVFSPDNDGFDDLATIRYQFGEAGHVCNVTIFNTDGRPVRNLVRNAVCGMNGYFRWDGLDEKNNPLNMGIYLLYIEVFNLEGKIKKFRKPVVLARKLR